MKHWRSFIFAAATVLSIGLGLWIHWPSVDSGFRSDDYVQWAMLRGHFPAQRSAFDLFDFASGDPSEAKRIQAFGYLPWWSDPALRLRMWRPISSALMAGDHALFGPHARPHHLHSMAWFVLLLISAALLLRELLPPSAAAFAICFFSVEEGHTVPVGWLASRNTLVATTLGFLATLAHVRFRKHGMRGGPWLSCVLTCLALLSGEYALTALAYVFAYECLARSESWATRARALLPVGLPAFAYVVAHSLLGRGALGSGYYLSPSTDPSGFLLAIFTRIPALIGDLVFGLPAAYYVAGSPWRNYVLSLGLFEPATWRKLPEWTTWHVLIGYLALALYALGLRALVRRLHESERPAILCLAIGALLALLPVAGALPGDRLVLGAALGVSALAALLLVRLSPFSAGPISWLSRGGRLLLACALLFTLGFSSLDRAYGQARGFRLESDALRVWSLDADLPQEHARDQRVYIICAGDFTTAVNLPWLRLMHGLPLPASYRRLQAGAQPVDILRLDERSLELNALASNLEGDAVPSLYRDRRHPLQPGFRTELPGLRVEVKKTVQGNPAATIFTFDRSVDDPSLWFLQSTAFGLRRIDMPKIGEKLRVPRPQVRDLRVLDRGFDDAASE